MKIQDIKTATTEIRELVRQSRLRDAYARLLTLTESTLDWEATRKVQQGEESYRYMLDYAAKGSLDPGRGELYNTLKDDILTVADRIERKASLREAPTLYFNTLRFEGMRGSETVPVLLTQYHKLSSADSLLDILADGGDEAAQANSPAAKEQLEKRIFDRIWVSFPLAGESVEAIRNEMGDCAVSDKFKQIIVGALLLGELQYHDAVRVELLVDAYAAASTPALKMASLVGVVISLNAHRDRPLRQSTVDRLKAMMESPLFAVDLKEVMREMIRTSDAERISSKLRDEIMPEMLKLRPDISKKFTSDNGLISLGDLEENPEWADKIEQSGLGKKLRELSEMQEQGEDVLLGAFAQLKNYPFFNDVVNWLRPYDSGHSQMTGIGEYQSLLDALDDGAQLCDSDKFSFTLSLSNIPPQQKQMLSGMLEAQAQQLAELRASSTNTEESEHKSYICSYMRNLSRFFKLFRRKGEFADPFKMDLNIADIPLFGDILRSESNMRLMGEFLFRRGLWEQALRVFVQLAGMVEESVELYQKIGYCEQRLGNIDKALENYLRAELLDSENHWTLRRIAACYRMLGKTAKALDYFTRLAKIYPDDVKLTMNIGHSLLELGKDAEAAECFYKVEFLEEKSDKALRPLAWALLRSGQTERARDYYNRILADNPVAVDYLNMGHLALTENNFREATNYYSMYVELSGGGVDDFVKAFTDDIPSLKVMGVDQSLIPLVIDQLLYSR